MGKTHEKCVRVLIYFEKKQKQTKKIIISEFIATGCWENDPHKRPGFRDILTKLEDIARSGFTLTPQESFNTMQDAWKKEIAEVLQELRLKEKVCGLQQKQKKKKKQNVM